MPTRFELISEHLARGPEWLTQPLWQIPPLDREPFLAARMRHLYSGGKTEALAELTQRNTDFAETE